MPTEAEPVGTTIAGRYLVEALLGRGGMGAVYRVQDQKTERRLALKRAYATSALLARKRRALLEREYHTLAQLAHPQIIEVYDFGIDDLGPFYTMELLDGADLQDADGLDWRSACALLRDVASSLAILHARGFVHRDVTTRNVRRTSDGRAKLLDFGAMASMGVSASVAGTPPFLAPEALQMQALDARADVYSLGALGYRILTGRHAYPARSLSDLRDAWRSLPIPVTRLSPEAPAALGALIGQCLALDRGARPQTAAEVMARVCAIAGLPFEEHANVQSAYLITPTLVGRDRALVAIRRRMLALVRGDGATLLIEGAHGSGRSRTLDTCALEAKLVGATVVRADARDSAADGDWAVARALVQRLLELLPSEVADAMRLARQSVTRLVYEDAVASSSSLPIPALTDRSVLIRELRDLVLAVAQSRRLLLIVDDADRIDEPSAAVLAAIAHKTERHPIVLALSIEARAGQAASGALRLLSATSERLALEELDAAQSEALLRSLFGDVNHLSFVAGRVHAIARGNPRAILELTQHLVDRGLARYSAGSWNLPAHLDERELPDSIASALRARLLRLTQPALELAQALAACDGDNLAVDDYLALLPEFSAARVYAALDELVAARILITAREAYVFSQRALLPVLESETPGARAKAIHGRCADRLRRTGGDVQRRAHHLVAAERAPEAVELLCGLDLHSSLPPLSLLERALQAAQDAMLPARNIVQLRMAVLSKAPLVLAFESFSAQWPAVMARLAADSSLRDYIDSSQLPAQQRLSRALAVAQARYDQTPERERVYDVLGSMRQLASVLASATSFGVASIDLAFLEQLPDVTPFEPLSAAFRLVHDMMEAGRYWVRGCYARAREIYAAQIERLQSGERAGLEQAQATRVLWGLRFLIAQLDAASGISIEDGAAALEREPSMRANAWQLRQVYCLSQGDLDGARKCQRRAELLRLQDGDEQYLVGMTSTIELLAAGVTEDLRAVRAALDSIALLSAHAPGWRPLLALAHSQLRALQGDECGALEALLPGLALVQPGRHLAWPLLATSHVALLVRLGHGEQALTEGARYVEQAERLQLSSGPLGLHTAMARALSAAGRFSQAQALLDARISQYEGLSYSGAAMGALYEQRAHCALDLHDRAGFGRFAQLCAQQYRRGNHPALAHRYARLLERASTRYREPVASLRPDAELLATCTQSEYATVHSRMQECADDVERARCALTLLLQDLESFTGVLYRVQAHDCGTALVALASVPEDPPPAALTRWAERWAAADSDPNEAATITRDLKSERTQSQDDAVVDRFTDELGRRFGAVALRLGDQTRALAGVVLFQMMPYGRNVPDSRLVAELAAELIERSCE